MLKQCKQCKQWLNEKHFYFRNDTQKFINICKKCHYEKIKANKEKNKEYYINYFKEWYQKNKDKIKLQHKEYRLNPEVKKYQKEYSKNWRQKNKERKTESFIVCRKNPS